MTTTSWYPRSLSLPTSALPRKPPPPVTRIRSEWSTLALLLMGSLFLCVVGQDAFALSQFPVGFGHHFGQRFERDLRLPTQDAARLAGITEEQIDLGRAEVARVDLHVALPVELEQAEHLVEEFADAVGFAGGDDEVVRLGLLEHEPH